MTGIDVDQDETVLNFVSITKDSNSNSLITTKVLRVDLKFLDDSGDAVSVVQTKFLLKPRTKPEQVKSVEASGISGFKPLS